MGVDVVVMPSLGVWLLGATLAGTVLGTISGLIPGLHANNFALLLASAAAMLPGDPLVIGVAMLAAGVTHSFLNVVPTLAIGVPDAEMAPMALPGHRLVLEGRGYEAIRLSALGSGLAVLLAVPLAVPISAVVAIIYPTVSAHIGLVLGAVVIGLIVSEPTHRSRLAGALSFGLSATLGALTLDLSPEAPLEAGGILAPLFAGLFGAPVLLDAMAGRGIPEQASPVLRTSRRRVLTTAGAGTLAGALVGYLPGVSAAIAAVAVLFLIPGDTDARGYIVATSGVDTANAIFALFALTTIGQPRSGVMVAFEEIAPPLVLPVLVGAVVLAGAVATGLTIWLGDRYLAVVGRLDPMVLSLVAGAMLIVLSGLFAGLTGVGVFVLATLVGLVPVRLGAYRVHLMGVLIGPIMLGV
ncbi:MAG: tripartite tricarboxylate transporter permease [Salinarchaeum sp.]